MGTAIGPRGGNGVSPGGVGVKKTGGVNVDVTKSRGVGIVNEDEAGEEAVRIGLIPTTTAPVGVSLVCVAVGKGE